jgi:hypothetical protein
MAALLLHASQTAAKHKFQSPRHALQCSKKPNHTQGVVSIKKLIWVSLLNVFESLRHKSPSLTRYPYSKLKHVRFFCKYV